MNSNTEYNLPACKAVLEKLLLSREQLCLHGFVVDYYHAFGVPEINSLPQLDQATQFIPEQNDNGWFYGGGIPQVNSIYPYQNYSVRRVCVRCNQPFYMTSDGEYITHEQCQYHWGKLHQTGSTSVYMCCNGSSKSKGCVTGQYHVWDGYVKGRNGPLEGYVRTSMTNNLPSDGDFGVYALDCEMSYTSSGLDVTKVTVLRSDGQVVYDYFVKPDKNIIDYNTRFSGITPENFADINKVKSFTQMQKDLLSFINEKSTLIGHSLNNDLRALKIIHTRVIDTSILFPHPLGLHFRQSLKVLAKRLLHRSINGGAEKARACLHLVGWYLKKYHI